MAGIRKDCDEKTKILARERSKELTQNIARFILRRRADIMQNLLPPKSEYYIFLSMQEF